MAYDQSSNVHALAFRVMRLSKPAIHFDPAPLRVILEEDMVPEGVASEGARLTPEQQQVVDASPYAHRAELRNPVDALGCQGLLELPVNFGTIYLGESFTSYISVGNYSDEAVTSVGIKAELQTERQKSILYDITATPLAVLDPDGRHDFIVRHDIKELGAHTLVCSTVYTSADGERKYMPQYFKFAASNPLSVRTKTRQTLDDIFLEACLENATKSPLFLEYVRFDPAPNVTAKAVDVKDSLLAAPGCLEGPLGPYISSAKMIGPNGGALQFLYHLQKAARPPGAPQRGGKDAPNMLGKLEMKWRNCLGEVGRLQTQQILGSSDGRKELDMHVEALPASLHLGAPFSVELLLRNMVDRRMGPLAVGLNPTTAGSTESLSARSTSAAIVLTGHDSMLVGELEAYEERIVHVQMMPLKPGVQRLATLHLYDTRDFKVFDSIANMEAYVN